MDFREVGKGESKIEVEETGDGECRNKRNELGRFCLD